MGLKNIDKSAEQKGSGIVTLWQFVKFIVVSLLACIVQFASLNLIMLLPQIKAIIHTTVCSGNSDSKKKYPYNPPISAEPSTPPIHPSSDLWGLSSGKICFFPISFPTQYAQVSHPQELMRIIHTI